MLKATYAYSHSVAVRARLLMGECSKLPQKRHWDLDGGSGAVFFGRVESSIQAQIWASNDVI